MFQQPVYLVGEDHHPIHRVRCPIHGFIRFSNAERRVVDDPIFRRLRYIRQLALTELIYPGATHTRFEHSLGVMEMASRIFDRVAADKGDLMEATFKEVAQLKDDTMAKARQICRLAALLHDTGHSCFSHAAEPVFHAGSDHESLTVHLLRSPDHLQKLLNDRFFPECAEVTATLVKPDPKSPIPQIKILRDIISGQIDADRTDYLLRDSYHCGVEYGRFDHRRLIECLTVWPDEYSGELEMALYRDGIHSFESLILARYQMSTQVYYHRLRRIYDYYLANYFKSLNRENFDTSEKILHWNDIRAMNELMLAASNEEKPGHLWAERIINRRHHRNVYELDDGAGVMEIKKLEKVYQKVRNEFPQIDFFLDLPEKPLSIHKIAHDDDQDQHGIDFPLIEGNTKTSLGERSQILKQLGKSFRIGIIFADIQDRKKRQEIRSRCLDLMIRS